MNDEGWADRTDPLAMAGRWLSTDTTVALASVVETWGSSPRPAGSLLAVRAGGDFAGSVSGGCVEGAVIQAAREVLQTGRSRLLEFTVSTEQAWDAGLACGGALTVHVEGVGPDPVRRLLDARGRRRPVARIVMLDGEERLLHPSDGLGALSDRARAAVADALRRGRSGIMELDGRRAFVHAFSPPLRLVIIGAVHIAQYLVRVAALAGYETVVVDPRQAFASPERFPGTTLVTDWPDKALRHRCLPDARTAVVTLSHDAKLDDPALEAALRSPAFYVGALGGRRTQAQRAASLAEAGLGEADIARIHGPIGLDLGGREPAEIAVAIMAEITATLHYGALGERPLRRSPDRSGHEAVS